MNPPFTRLRRFLPADVGGLILALALLSGCEDREAAFTSGRVTESCNESWPVCDVVAGCIIGNESFVGGRFPGNKRVVVRVEEPSRVTASFYLADVTGAGTTSVLTFYEGGCSARTRLEIPGDTMVKENESVGFVARDSDLADLGDHRIEFSSDVQARYVFKVDVTPLRLAGGGGL